ncbi:hypothetical protein GCM10029992_15360 [Glycomyces albus]
MHRRHSYEVTVEWTGDLGSGTSGYRAFSRDNVASVEGKASIAGSSDPAFRGDASRWNPEELLVVSLSQCHMLWYLHLCSAAGCGWSATSTVPAGSWRWTSAAAAGRSPRSSCVPR